VSALEPNTVWIIFDAEDTPLGLQFEVGTTLPVFERPEFAREWLGEDGQQEGMSPKAIPPAELVRLCDEYGSQLDYYVWVDANQMEGFRVSPLEGGGDLVKTLELWQLKMWAQYGSGDEGWKDTARRQSI
jgi:hypothetical protein